MEIKIQLGKTFMELGVLGLPNKATKNWSAISKNGKFIYDNIESDITITPKHIDFLEDKAGAWQFTINNSIQFTNLKIQAVNTYVENTVCGEYIILDIEEKNDLIYLKVKDLILKETTPATLKIQELLKQGIREKVQDDSQAPKWNAPSAWIPFKDIEKYKAITDCMYMWYGKNKDIKDETIYLYVGIVGDSKTKGKSKRNLTQRLKEEQKKYSLEQNVDIVSFRYCSLNNPEDFHIPILLKTIEMSVITTMTSLFPCDNARKNISPLFEKEKIKLLNSMTSYKYIE